MGEIKFGTTLAVIKKWTKEDDLTVMFPTYYQGDLGENPLCFLWGTVDKKVKMLE